MKELNEKLYTPNDVAEMGIMCLAKQWSERKSGRLQCYRLGKKILYAQKHLDAYLELCESGESNENSNSETLK